MWLNIVGVRTKGNNRKDYDNATYELKPDAADTIRKIFELSLTVGTFEITRRFNREQVPTFGKGKHWARSYIHKILRDRAVLGWWQPRRKAGHRTATP